jgi:hypothetical protein
MQYLVTTATRVWTVIVLVIFSTIRTDKLVFGTGFGVMAGVKFPTCIANAFFVGFTFKDHMSSLETVSINAFVGRSQDWCDKPLFLRESWHWWEGLSGGKWALLWGSLLWDILLWGNWWWGNLLLSAGVNKWSLLVGILLQRGYMLIQLLLLQIALCLYKALHFRHTGP